MPLPTPRNKDHEEFLDMLAYILATTSPTSAITWILGDLGQGPPLDNQNVLLPFGYISALDEKVLWERSRGGLGGVSAGGTQGVDDWGIPVSLTVAFARHQYLPPIAAFSSGGSASSAFNPANLGSTPPYLEQPGWRAAEELTQQIKGVLRLNPIVGGEVASCHIVESRYVLTAVGDVQYRAIRLRLDAQQRRTRGT